MVWLFEHKPDNPPDICRLNQGLDIEHVLGVNREMGLQMCLDKARLKAANAHTRPGPLHTQILS